MNRTGKEMTEISILSDVAVLTLNDPPANRLSFNMFNDFSRNLNHVFGMKNIQGIIITGAGRHFSSGSDPVELQAEAQYHICHSHRSVLEAIHESKIPVIAAVKGVCLGSACELALACHFRLASPNAVLGLPESSFAMMPGLGGIKYLTSLTGMAKSLEVILTGDTFSAGTALSLGIIDHIPEKSQIIETSIELIKKLNGRFRAEFRKIYVEKYLKAQND